MYQVSKYQGIFWIFFHFGWNCNESNYKGFICSLYPSLMCKDQAEVIEGLAAANILITHPRKLEIYLRKSIENGTKM